MSKSATRCTVCGHRERATIDLALARGVSPRAVARRFKLGSDSAYRHARRHLPPQLRAKLIAGPDLAEEDLDRLRTNESASLLGNLVALRRRLYAGLDSAEEAGDSTIVSRVASQLHRNLELTAKLLGDLSSGTTINNTSILIMPVYVELRVALMRALAPYPEARTAVAEAIHTLEHKAADTIQAEAAAA